MEYFLLEQDMRYNYIPQIDDFYSQFMRRDFSKSRCNKIPNKNVVFCYSEKPVEKLDVLDRQCFLISESVKQVFGLYEPTMKFKMFCIINNLRMEYYNYFVPILEELDCLSADSETNSDKSVIKRMILDSKKTGSHAIFKIAGINTDKVVVRLDVTESLLRRKCKGIQLKSIEMK